MYSLCMFRRRTGEPACEPHSCACVHPAPARRYELHWPASHVQCLASPTLYTLTKLPPPPAKPRRHPVPDAQTIYDFVENIWHKARYLMTVYARGHGGERRQCRLQSHFVCG